MSPEGATQPSAQSRSSIAPSGLMGFDGAGNPGACAPG
jgi:hypothetical protein